MGADETSATGWPERVTAGWVPSRRQSAPVSVGRMGNAEHTMTTEVMMRPTPRLEGKRRGCRRSPDAADGGPERRM